MVKYICLKIFSQENKKQLEMKTLISSLRSFLWSKTGFMAKEIQQIDAMGLETSFI